MDIDLSPLGIRLATKVDEDEIFALLSMLHEENGFFTMNPTKVRDGIRRATDRKGGIVGVIEDRGRIVGTIGLFIEQDWYTDDFELLERWNFVHPDYRKSDYAKRMIEFAKRCQEWFERQGNTIPLIIGVFSTVKTVAKVRLYRRQLPFAGGFFIYGRTPRLPENSASTIDVPKIKRGVIDVVEHAYVR